MAQHRSERPLSQARRPWLTITAALGGLAMLLAVTPAEAEPPFAVEGAWAGQGFCLTPSSVSAGTVEGRLRRVAREVPDGDARIASPLGRDGVANAGASSRQLYILMRYGFDAAPAMGRGGRAWSAADLDLAAAAMADLPANALPFSGGVRRALMQGKLLDPRRQLNSAVETAEASALGGDSVGGVRVGSTWEELPPEARRAVVLHELAHEFLAAQDPRLRWDVTWTSAVAADDALAHSLKQRSSTVSRYAAKNLEEDFAESVVAYRYRPDILAARAPARYALLRAWVFDGLEYFSAASCMPAAARSEQVRLAAETALDAAAADLTRVAALQRDCRRAIDTDACVLRRLFAAQLGASWRRLEGEPENLSAASLAALQHNDRYLTNAVAHLSAETRARLLGQRPHSGAIALTGGQPPG